MCIAIFSQIGNEIPNDEILKTCFRNNNDGCGIAFNTDNNHVKIVKGFMDFESFITALHEYDEKFNLTHRGVLIHFRIGTSGKTIKGGYCDPSCTHPFPISSKDKHLKKLKFTSNYAVIHNGIISLTADRKSPLSDTQLFVKDYLTKISSNRSWFYNPKNIKLIEKLIDSKMAILNGRGEIIATEGFHQGEDGNYYSNDSYKNLYYGLYSWDFEDYYNIFANDREEYELECPLMRLKSNESICYVDGNIENYENGYHNLYSHYVTKEGDIYADYVDCCYLGRIPLDKLTYLGEGKIISKQSPFSIVDFRKDATGYI